MTRILERSETGPMKIGRDEIAGDAIYLCRCGLSRNQPYCDGTHKMTRDEAPNVLVRYVVGPAGLVRQAVEVRADAAPAASEPR
jgi:CDGSH iron-sulfur domain-containing protein 1